MQVHNIYMLNKVGRPKYQSISQWERRSTIRKSKICIVHTSLKEQLRLIASSL